MTYDEAINYIHSFRKYRERRSLEDTRALLASLGSPEMKMRYIHVAGTNGKGSVAAMLESILRAAGYKTGLFTSPYLTRFNERIRVNGEDIPDGDLAALVESVRPAAEGLERMPTEFELVTVLGLMYFVRRGCDIAVMECGLGGRFDYTNVIPSPEAAVITRLGLDHTERLGKTLDEIAWHKAGIIKPGSAAVLYEHSAVCEAEAERAGARVVVAPEKPGIPVKIPLAGDFQIKNAALAEATARALGIGEDAIRAGLEAVRWPGRFELISIKPDIILDGSHNPQAVREAAGEFGRRCAGRRLAVVTGIMADKDVDGVIRELSALDARFFAVPVDYPRALGAGEYAERMRARGLEAEAASSIPEGVKKAREYAGENGAVLALGTLYFSADVRRAALER